MHLARKCKLLYLSGCFSLSHRGSWMSVNGSLLYVWRIFSECTLQHGMSVCFLQCSVNSSLTFPRDTEQSFIVTGITSTSSLSIFLLLSRTQACQKHTVSTSLSHIHTEKLRRWDTSLLEGTAEYKSLSCLVNPSDPFAAFPVMFLLLSQSDSMVCPRENIFHSISRDTWS